jgi:hypothetical protein
MTSLSKAVGLALIGFGMAFAGGALADDARMEAAMQACGTGGDYSEQEKAACETHVLAVLNGIDQKSEGTIHFDFNDDNDSPEEKTAKQAMYDAVDACEQGGKHGADLTDCHMAAFRGYQDAASQ